MTLFVFDCHFLLAVQNIQVRFRLCKSQAFPRIDAKIWFVSVRLDSPSREPSSMVICVLHIHKHSPDFICRIQVKIFLI